MLNFSTLFDHNYLSRALVLYESLRENCSEPFRLYTLATDDIAYNWLTQQKFDNIIIYSLHDLKTEYPVLERLQKERTRAEFSWTLSSFSTQYVLRKNDIESLTYLDADLCFYNDPKYLFDELKDESVIITPHNYTPRYDMTKTSGRYCVQFMYFKNNKDGNKVLEWWRAACEECCCASPMNGKFGDQKYLDDWLSRFPGIVHEEKHMGCGIAPWNVQQFDIEKKETKFLLRNKITKLQDNFIFFHFHGLKEGINKENKIVWNLGEYELSNFELENLYRPYTQKLEEIAKTVPKRSYSNMELPKQKFYFFKLLFKTGKRSLKLFILSFMFIRTMKNVKKEEDIKKNKFIIN